MDLKELRKRFTPTTKPQDDANSSINGGSRAQPSSSSFLSLSFFAANITKTFSALLIILPVFVVFSFVHRNPDRSYTTSTISPFANARVLESKTPFTPPSLLPQGINISRESVKVPDDPKLLNGLLSSKFDEASCLSRYQSYTYRKTSSFTPSTYLLSKVRSYEELHTQCGPGTQPYNDALQQLNSPTSTASPTECNLLSNRILLIDPGIDMTDLFCEPFPSSSWFLAKTFPLINQFEGFNQNSPNCHGYMLKNNHLNASSDSVDLVPPYLYLHLGHDYNDHDKLFFCDDEQTLLSKVPWLIMKTDNYFVPSLYLIPSFEEQLYKLFPEKFTIFHHLGRYLFHPTNQVWGLITRYYNAYLANADERVGIQIRTFEDGPGPYQHAKEQIQSCLSREKILPEISKKDSIFTSFKTKKSISVITTSLNSGYYETLRELYWEYPTVSGNVVVFYQPSHEGFQQSQNKTHNRKAWAEMYLLSLTDKLVTSAWSTFGYVAQGLGGLKPWILYKPEDKKTPNPPCGRAMSIEPCFHAPPFWDCKAKKGIDTGKLVPHVRHCEDISWGLKVVDGREEV